MKKDNLFVIPAKAGTELFKSFGWIPAYAGMTRKMWLPPIPFFPIEKWIPACAGMTKG